MNTPLEKMDAFFNARADGYEAHMFANVAGTDKYYAATAALFPQKPFDLLDLGCGTGLELDEIFKRSPNARVTGMDVSADMLAILRKKHSDKSLTLIQESYQSADLGRDRYDAVVSVQTMHHFTPFEKRAIYRKIFNALKKGGFYIETDYTAKTPAEERACRDELRRLKQEEHLPDGLYHFDIPCTKETQIDLLKKAGFSPVSVQGIFGNAVIISACKRDIFSHKPNDIP